MKKILLIFTLLFAFSFLAYGQKLIREDQKDNLTVLVYEDQIIVKLDNLGMCVLKEEGLAIFCTDIKESGKQINFFVDENNVTVTSTIEINKYSIDDNKYKFNNFKILSDGSYGTTFNKNHFIDLINNDKLFTVEINDYYYGFFPRAFFRILSVSYYEEYVKNYPVYNKYLK